MCEVSRGSRSLCRKIRLFNTGMLQHHFKKQRSDRKYGCDRWTGTTILDGGLLTLLRTTNETWLLPFNKSQLWKRKGSEIIGNDGHMSFDDCSKVSSFTTVSYCCGEFAQEQNKDANMVEGCCPSRCSNAVSTFPPVLFFCAAFHMPFMNVDGYQVKSWKQLLLLTKYRVQQLLLPRVLLTNQTISFWALKMLTWHKKTPLLIKYDVCKFKVTNSNYKKTA